MQISSRKSQHRSILLAALTLLVAAPTFAQNASRLTVELDADSTRADGPNGVIEFSGITIKQGDLSVRADHARSSGLDFENSAWTFSGSVEFRSADARVSAAKAVLRFEEQKLADATLEGSPMKFQQRRGDNMELTGNDARLEFAQGELARAYFRGKPVEFSQAIDDKLTSAHADSLVYDAAGGTVTLQDNAWIGDGGSEIAGNRIMYNLAEQKIVAASDESGQQRVRITITPPAKESDGDSEPEQQPQSQ